MKTSRKQISPGVIFGAGTLVGAFAVYVPLASAGHPVSTVERSGQRSPSSARISAPAAGPNAVDAGSSSSITQNSGKSNQPSNEVTCDVQLD